MIAPLIERQDICSHNLCKSLNESHHLPTVFVGILFFDIDIDIVYDSHGYLT